MSFDVLDCLLSLEGEWPLKLINQSRPDYIVVLSLFCLVSESGNLCLDSLSYLEEEQCVRSCVKDAQGRTICSGKEKEPSDTKRSLVSISVSLHVGFLCLSQQWQFWQLDVWQLPAFFTTVFICLNKEVPFFPFPWHLEPWKIRVVRLPPVET